MGQILLCGSNLCCRQRPARELALSLLANAGVGGHNTGRGGRNRRAEGSLHQGHRTAWPGRAVSGLSYRRKALVAIAGRSGRGPGRIRADTDEYDRIRKDAACYWLVGTAIFTRIQSVSSHVFSSRRPHVFSHEVTLPVGVCLRALPGACLHAPTSTQSSLNWRLLLLLTPSRILLRKQSVW